jgi:hypothetical protein
MNSISHTIQLFIWDLHHILDAHTKLNEIFQSVEMTQICNQIITAVVAKIKGWMDGMPTRVWYEPFYARVSYEVSELN